MTSLGQDPSMEFAVPIHTEPQPGFVIPKTKPELASAVITVVSSVTVQFAPASSAMQEITQLSKRDRGQQSCGHATDSHTVWCRDSSGNM